MPLLIEFIGFISEHDLTEESKTLLKYHRQHPKDEYLTNQIIKPLESGTLILGWIGYTYDVKDQFIIAPDAYYTDGTLIWPAYLTYYFLKYSTFNLDERIVIRYLTTK